MLFTVIDNKTGKEADLEGISLTEDWAKTLMPFDMEGFALQQDGTLILVDECNQWAYAPKDRFTILWSDLMIRNINVIQG